MSAPTIQIQVGFQTTANFGTPFQLDNPTFGELDTGTLGGVQLVDVTDQGESITITRGRNRETEQFNAGTATVVFDDPERIFDPLNTASPYYPFVGPRNPIIISANGIPIFTGVVSDWDLDYGFTTSSNVTSVQCVDDFTVFANQALGLFTPAEESSGERVEDVLTRPEVVYQGRHGNLNGGVHAGRVPRVRGHERDAVPSGRHRVRAGLYVYVRRRCVHVHQPRRRPQPCAGH
jgi:hypothetical protein